MGQNRLKYLYVLSNIREVQMNTSITLNLKPGTSNAKHQTSNIKPIQFFLLLIFVGCLNLSTFPQSVLPNNPPSLKWHQVNTPNFKVIYPNGFEVQAQRMANTLEHIHDPEARTLGSSLKRFRWFFRTNLQCQMRLYPFFQGGRSFLPCLRRIITLSAILIG